MPPSELKKRPLPSPPEFWTEGVLTRQQVFCPVCYGILLEPVSFPCVHTICFACYEKHVRETSLYCPICRYRLSIWSRRATKDKSLINVIFWERIKEQFQEEVEKCQAGLDTEAFLSTCDSPSSRDGFLANEGEIRQEFETCLHDFDQQIEIERKKEEEASSVLIQQIQLEEPLPPPPQSPTQLQSDFELAAKLQEEENRLVEALRNDRMSRESARTSASPGSSVASTSSASSSLRPKPTAKKRSSPSTKLSKAKKSKPSTQLKISNFLTPSFSSSPLSSSNSNNNLHSIQQDHLGTNAELHIHIVSSGESGLQDRQTYNAGIGTTEYAELEEFSGPAATAAAVPAEFSESLPADNGSAVPNFIVQDSDTDSEQNFVLDGNTSYPGLLLPGQIKVPDNEDHGNNETESSSDAESVETDVSSNTHLFEIYLEEQRDLERQIKIQEEEDRKFAMNLQRKLNARGPVEREEYSLRKKRNNNSDNT